MGRSEEDTGVRMLLVLGIVALLVVLAAVGGAMLVGARHAREEDGPRSHPTDFVARAGATFAFRTTGESTGEFQARVDKDRAAPESEDPKSPSK